MHNEYYSWIQRCWRDMIEVHFQWKIAVHHSFLRNRSIEDSKRHRSRQILQIAMLDQEMYALSGTMLWSAPFDAVDEHHDHYLIGLHSESPILAILLYLEPVFPLTLSHQPWGSTTTTNNFSELSNREEFNGAIGATWIATGTIFSEVKVGGGNQRRVTGPGVPFPGTVQG